MALPGLQSQGISIHALREEGDTTWTTAQKLVFYFYPRPPRGGRQRPEWRQGQGLQISIHALREEGDCRVCLCKAPPGNFYPRPPRGGRLYVYDDDDNGHLFLSTPSARRATITLLESMFEGGNFYPRPPRGGRPVQPPPAAGRGNFYPRPPRGGRQQKQRQNLYFLINYTTFCTNLEEP